MAHKDPRSHHYHAFQNNRQDWSIDRWCRGLRIQRQRLEQHPYFGDVATLLMFDAWQSWFNQQDKKIWTQCWIWSWQHKLPLKLYHKQQLLNILAGIEHRKQAFESRQRKRQHIQARIERRKLAAV
jgi:hypothetical protein